MRFKKIAIVAFLLVVAGTVTPLLLLKPWNQASDEMRLLRQVEHGLKLPPSADRTENDTGTYHDKKGNTHSIRSITNNYHDASAFATVLTTLTSQGWRQQYTIDADGTKSIMLLNLSARACLELHTVSPADGKQPDRIVLLAASDDACSGYFVLY